MHGVKVGEIRSVPNGAEKCRNLLRLPDDEEFELVYGFMEHYGNP